jgi:hypothetical protein
MKKILALIVVLSIAGVAIWYLPWWLTLGLLAITVMPVLIVVVAFLAIVKSLKSEFKKQFADVLPRTNERKLAANELFQGNGFRFALPVACKVSQTVLDDFEALMIKPELHGKRKHGDSLLIISTIPVEEMKENVTAKLGPVFERIEELHASEFTPISVGSLTGEHRTFEASKDGHSAKGESAYLGDSQYSVAWQIITKPDAFDEIAAKYRAMAKLIQRERATD